MFTGGFQGTWEILLSLPLDNRNEGKPVKNTPDAQGRCAQPLRDQKDGRKDSTAKRRMTKCGGMGSRKSEDCIVPMKQGNRPEGPSGGKAVSERWNHWREQWVAHRCQKAFQRNSNG